MENYIKVLDKKLWVKEIYTHLKKDKPTLIFLHEALGCIDMWKSFPEELCLKTGLNGLIYDRQGHGQSDPMTLKRGKDYLHIEALEYLPALIKKIGIKKPILVGHSDGGTIALIYAAFHNVEAVITEAAHIYVEKVTTSDVSKVLEVYHSAGLKERLSKYHGDKTDDLFYAWADTWTSDWFADWNIKELLHKIKAPVLAIQGKEDEYASVQHLYDIVEEIGENAESVLIDNCQHIPHFQAKEFVLEIMNNFIQKLDY